MGEKKPLGDPKKANIYNSAQIRAMELKLWHIAQVSIVTKCTKFEPNRPTPISRSAPVSQAEALNCLFSLDVQNEILLLPRIFYYS